MNCCLRCFPGEKMVALAAAFSVEFACGTDANEILAWSDLFGMVTANLITLANRKLYINDPTGDCHPQKKESKPEDKTKTESQSKSEKKTDTESQSKSENKKKY